MTQFSISYIKQISAHSWSSIRTQKNLRKRKEIVIGCMDIRPREKIKIDMETYQENWAGVSLHSQKLLSRGLAEKLLNTVFKAYALSIKIKALKIVDRDRIWLVVLSIIVYWWLKFVLFVQCCSRYFQYYLLIIHYLFFLDEIIRLGKD